MTALQHKALVACALVPAGGFVYLCNMEITLEQQLFLGWSTVLLIFLLKASGRAARPRGRILFLLLVAFVSLRYFIWRTFDTLIYTGPADFVAMALVYMAEMQVSAVHFLNMFVNAWPMERPIVPLPEDPSLLPTVDVFVPAYTEAEELVRITVIGCTQMDYPKDKLNVYILDDGSTEERRNDPVLGASAWHRHSAMSRMAEELGVGYLTRERNEHAKAGNINAALKHTNGELILILDCDHIPTQDLLTNTVGGFLRDPKLFLVQTPHFFGNPTPIEKNLGTHAHTPGEHEMFYRANQPALDFWNASFFCGSAGVLRRTFLETAGGIATRSITEDAETALTLHGHGYNSAYIARPMVCGLSPETFADFIVQRTRWCQGMLQTAILHDPVLARGLKLPQRICYFSCVLFWFFGLSRFIFFLAPTLFILFDLQVYHASVSQIVAYGFPHLVAALMSSHFLFGKYQWPLFSDLYESVQSIFLAPAVLGVISNPANPKFKVTPKGQNIKQTFLSPLALPFLAMFAVMLICVPITVYKWFDQPMYRDVLLVCGAWLALNILVAAAALGSFLERLQTRRHHRAPRSGGTVHLAAEDRSWSAPADLVDLSLTGMCVRFAEPVRPDTAELLTVQLVNRQGEEFTLRARVVRRRTRGDTTECGLEFADYEQDLQSLVRLVYGDSQNWVDAWERTQPGPGIIAAAMQLLGLARKGLWQTVFSLRRAYAH